MPINLKHRSFVKELDWTPDELRHVLQLARELKAAKKAGTETPRLTGKNIALIFEKSSTRTRCAFEVAAFDQGAHVTYLGPEGTQIGSKESMRDTARVLGRMYDAIEYRGFAQASVEELAAYSGVPVYNGLTDEFHPTQMLADILTMQEHCAKPLNEIAYCFVGDTRFNVGNSLMVIGAMLGMDVRLCAPTSLMPSPELIARCRALAQATGARLMLTDNVAQAVSGVDYIYTDVWVSMGEPDSVWGDRIELLMPYQVNRRMLELSGNPSVKFMHCLPAFHDTHTKIGRQIQERFGVASMEVTDDVFESDQSIVFDQAENRLHTIKALMVATLAD